MPNAVYSTRQVAEILGVATWRIQRIFEDGDVPEPARFAGNRMVNGAMVPTIVDALRSRGWLPTSADRVPVTTGAK